MKVVRPATYTTVFSFVHYASDNLGQLENTETREREREREGTPKTEVDVFDRAGHKAIVF